MLQFSAQKSSLGQQALSDLEKAIEQPLPASVREWYELERATELIARYSNADHSVPISEMSQSLILGGGERTFLIFKRESQGVCAWGILLNGTDDPPVFLDFESGFESPVQSADSFSQYVYSCVWDYSQVIASDSLLLQAQNGPLSEGALQYLCQHFDQGCVTYGWPSERQHRFSKGTQRILIWANAEQADWFLRANTVNALESMVRLIGHVDFVREALWSNDAQGLSVLQRCN